MFRSLIAALVAVFAGLAAAQAVERLAAALSLPQWAALLAGWGVASFTGAGLALMIGKRWAPLGWLAAASMFLLAVVTAANGAGWVLIPGAIFISAAGGFLAIKLLKARYEPPFVKRDTGMF